MKTVCSYILTALHLAQKNLWYLPLLLSKMEAAQNERRNVPLPSVVVDHLDKRLNRPKFSHSWMGSISQKLQPPPPKIN